MARDADISIPRLRFEKPAHYCTCLLLIALCWFSHFSRFREMGFYEDDHWFAASTLNWSAMDLLRYIIEQIRIFPHPQGRPIGFILGKLIPFISYRIGGLPAIYVAGWIIFSTNAVLFFTLLRRCLAPPLPLIGAIAFILFPADTTRPFICHADILQPSVLFTLIACHLQLSSRSTYRCLAYLFALFSLLTYETALLPFVVFPLLNLQWKWRWARQFSIHLLILLILGCAFFVIRKSGGESRVVDASMTTKTIARQIWTGTGIGIDTVLKLSRTRAMQGEEDFEQRRQPRSELKIVGIVIGLSVLASSIAPRRNKADSPPGPNFMRPQRRESAQRSSRRNQKGESNTETRRHGEEKTEHFDKPIPSRYPPTTLSDVWSFLFRASVSPCLIRRSNKRNLGISMKEDARKKEDPAQSDDRRVLSEDKGQGLPLSPSFRTLHASLCTLPLSASALRAAAFGLAGFCIAYLFCFTHYPPDYEEGRLTSTHLAATLPAATLMAVVAVIPILLLPRFVGPVLTAGAVGFYFLCLFSAACDEQRGYVQIWRARQHLWTRIIHLCPDVTDCTLIAFEGPVPQPAYFMGTASWSDFMVLDEIFNFAPSQFHRNPMAAHFPAGAHGEPTWQNDITLDSAGQLIWNHSPFGVGASQPVFDRNLILLHIDEAGNVKRDRGMIQLCGQSFHLKDPPAAGSSPPFPRLPLYTILTGRPRE